MVENKRTQTSKLKPSSYKFYEVADGYSIKCPDLSGFSRIDVRPQANGSSYIFFRKPSYTHSTPADTSDWSLVTQKQRGVLDRHETMRTDVADTYASVNECLTDPFFPNELKNEVLILNQSGLLNPDKKITSH